MKKLIINYNKQIHWNTFYVVFWLFYPIIINEAILRDCLSPAECYKGLEQNKGEKIMKEY